MITRFSLALVLVFSSCFNSSAEESNKNTHIVMRVIGHEVLLALGDSSSLVLPIENDGNRFQIKFSSPFGFDPSALAVIIDSVIQTNKVAEHYVVEFFDCSQLQAVHNYEVTLGEDLMPCAGRIYPESCYWIQITLIEVPFSVGEEVDQAKEDSPWLKFLLVFLIIGLIAFVLIRFRIQRLSKVSAEKIMIGSFRFDTKNKELILNNERIELTEKETQLLEILNESANHTVDRETILNAVWEDDGDYVGRTLDVFVSKLRKKLEADDNVKIISIRGIGYKLILNG